MVTKAEAQVLAGKFITDEITISEDLWAFLYHQNTRMTRDQHQELHDVVYPLVTAALQEIGSFTEYEGRKALALREQQLNRVKAVIEQFGITSIHPEDNSVISAMADALFGAEL
jgi:propanediol dehydratase large subunit